MRPVLLDFYCCEGGAGAGYDRAGFDVVGVDIVPQPRYPFRFVKADFTRNAAQLIATHRPAALHGSPPCQAHSDAQRIQDNEHADLIPVTRRVFEASGLPYIIENVGGAREHLIDPVMLCGSMFPELNVYRHRLFESNLDLTVPEHGEHEEPQVKMGRPPRPGHRMHIVGNFSGVAEGRTAMGMDWASRDGLREAIPPAYTEYLGQQMLAVVDQRRAA